MTPLASTITDNILSDIQDATGAVIKKSEDAAAEKEAEAASEASTEEELLRHLLLHRFPST